jgi:hypothetical protein
VVRYEDRLGLIVPVVFGGVGLLFIGTALVATSSGFWIRNEQLISENGLSDNVKVFRGVLLATAPAAIFAFRLGRSGASRRTLFRTGVLGLWLPVISSATLASLAKVCGARLYWRPSVPIDAGAIFAWANRSTAPWIVIALMTLTALPLMSLMFWIKETMPRPERSWKDWLLIVGIGSLGLALVVYDRFSFQAYYGPWLWSVLIAALPLAVWSAALALRRPL